jgi:hypothetical protein
VWSRTIYSNVFVDWQYILPITLEIYIAPMYDNILEYIAIAMFPFGKHQCQLISFRTY